MVSVVISQIQCGCPTLSSNLCSCKASAGRIEISCGKRDFSKNTDGAYLKNLFANLDKDFNKDVNYTAIDLHYMNIKVLQANTFNGIKFQSIVLPYNNELVRIDQDAFKGTEEHIENFEMYNATKLDPVNLFDTLKKFTNIKSIFLLGIYFNLLR